MVFLTKLLVLINIIIINIIIIVVVVDVGISPFINIWKENKLWFDWVASPPLNPVSFEPNASLLLFCFLLQSYFHIGAGSSAEPNWLKSSQIAVN